MEKTTNRIYTSDDVYKALSKNVCRIRWNSVWYKVYAFNGNDIWVYNEASKLYKTPEELVQALNNGADELHTTHDQLAQALNNGDTVEFYKLEKVEI